MTDVMNLPITHAADTTVDLLVIGSGTGLLAALAAREQGMSTLGGDAAPRSPWQAYLDQGPTTLQRDGGRRPRPRLR